MQHPHWLVSQPTWVPVRCKFSLRKWTRSVLSSTSEELASQAVHLGKTIAFFKVDMDGSGQRLSIGAGVSREERSADPVIAHLKAARTGTVGVDEGVRLDLGRTAAGDEEDNEFERY